MQKAGDDYSLQKSALISGNLDHNLVLAGCDLVTGEMGVCGFKLIGYGTAKPTHTCNSGIK